MERTTSSTPARFIGRRLVGLALLISLVGVILAGCIVVPVGHWSPHRHHGWHHRHDWR